VASLSWQDPEEELIILLLMKVSDRERNVRGKNIGCAKIIVYFCNEFFLFVNVHKVGLATVIFI